ncbi:trehalose operon repressor [Pseudalkalibacillus caeni]|uniref:Trehalose operon repressor n=1 Tax=Exobacillus caeni TaxID=2574798 RepID=A0A5R9EZH1_9BACL|nr:trehalose operon repressor [Pseudalkalibacillus caeni]TLS35859.1 trehalose operon repressor [Pseudalkalibacillus caeni]
MKNNKYMIVYNELAEQIKNGKLKPGIKLPSEHELSSEYHTSRETIRKALTLLSQNGFIQKIKGKGSVVLDVTKYDFPVSGLVSFKEISQRMNMEYKTHVEELELIVPDEYIRDQLDLSKKDKVWKVVRVREINKERIILDKDYFNKKFVPSLTKDICEDSIYNYLENELKVNISFAKKEIVVEEATDEDRQLMDLNDYEHIVVVRNYVYLKDTSLLEYTESRHRLDKFKFVDFARREK